MHRPITTLFMLMSVDGKISTGSTDELDVDRRQVVGFRHRAFRIKCAEAHGLFRASGFLYTASI